MKHLVAYKCVLVDTIEQMPSVAYNSVKRQWLAYISIQRRLIAYRLAYKFAC